MDEGLVRFGLTAFVTLLVVVDPPGVVPIFVALTEGADAAKRRATVKRAVIIALLVALFFLVAGRSLLSYLGVTIHAFAISGGVLLFATALPMLFGHRGGLQAPEREERPTAGEDIAIFPLAIPLLSGPGAIATILLLTAQANGDTRRLVALGLAVVLVYGVSLIMLRLGGSLMARIGEGKVHIVTRVMGIILAALAVQFILNGITAYYELLTGR
ncbi:MAG TPA: MarC family protein [Pyrinomonadaceae bacterium]